MLLFVSDEKNNEIDLKMFLTYEIVMDSQLCPFTKNYEYFVVFQENKCFLCSRYGLMVELFP